MKATTPCIVTGVLGVIKKGMRSTVEEKAGKINIEELQKITLMASAHILRKFLQLTYEALFILKFMALI